MTNDKLIEAMRQAVYDAIEAGEDAENIARAALAAAESAGYRLVPVGSEESNGVVKNKWRPIESAPKDRSVLLAVSGGTVPVYCGRLRYGQLGEPQQDEFAWRCDSSGRFADPSHWMPLPAAPEVGRE